MNPQTRPRSAFKEISLLWQSWWRRQTPSRQDRFAFMGPLTAVIMFFAAISSAFWYLRYEEMEREQESVRRDVESAQQQLRLRLIERQEQMMRLARDAANGDMGVISFATRAVLGQLVGCAAARSGQLFGALFTKLSPLSPG